MDAHKRTTEGSIMKSIIFLAWPIILANVLQSAYQLTDSFWVGRLGQGAVAAVAMSGPILFLTTSLGIGLAIAGAILVAQYFGAKDGPMVNKSASQTILMVTIASIVLGAIGWILTPTILKALGASADFLPMAVQYLRIAFVALIFNFCFFMFESIMRSIGRPTVPLYIIGATVALNFLLDPLFIFGWGPFPALGVAGAAMATLGTQSLASIAGLVILFGGRRGIHLKWKDFRPDLQFIKRSFLLGLPASIDMSARSLGMTVMTGLVASFGTLAIASYGAASNIIMVSVIIGLGVSSANATLVGQNIGAGNLDRAAKASRYSAVLSFISLTAIGAIVYLTAPALIAFFVPGEPALIAEGSTLLRITTLFFGFMGLQMTYGSVYQASGNTTISMALTIFSQWVLQLPLAYLLARHTNLGMRGIWISFPATNVLTAGVSWLVYRTGNWKKKRIINNQAEAKEDALEKKVTQEIMAEDPVPYDY